MEIENGWINNVNVIKSPNTSGKMSNPTVLVLHYTASGNTRAGAAKYFANKSAKASAHIVLDRDGYITQCVSFNEKAWHAGKSSWKGVPNCNDYSIGIEISNWGILTRTEDGVYKSYTGQEISPDKVLGAKNKLGNFGYWEIYPKEQLVVLESLIDAILKEYPSIKFIVGHEDIAPMRKADPGPALYYFMTKVQEKLVGDRKGLDKDSKVYKRTVISSDNLNVRSGPGFNFPVIEKVGPGKIVDVSYSADGWSRINWPAGWVYNQYLG